jgi:hypothetical protein
MVQGARGRSYLVNLKGLIRKKPWPISGCFPFINMERLSKIINKVRIKVAVFCDVASCSLVDID